MQVIRFLLLLVTFLLGPCLVAEELDPKSIQALIEKARRSWNVPGVAVAVIRNDKVIYLKGHGTKDVDGKDPVTPDTLFPLASCSKAFTTTAMAILVDRNKLRWDDSVRKHVPYFKLSDPIANAQVTLRDLVTHRTGLGPHDFLWYRAAWSPKECVRRIGLVKPDRPIRTGFAYQSTMFTTAGFAVASASKSKWEEFIKKELFVPLKMKTACCTTLEAEKVKDRAIGHALNERGQPTPEQQWYPMKLPDPAGSICSSARDLVPWLRLHLNEGLIDGQRIVTAEALRETHSPQMIIPKPKGSPFLYPDSHFLSYGMAWVNQDYRGHRLVAHSGIIDGFQVQITLVPKQKLGFVILSNLHSTRMNLGLSYTLLDFLLHLKAKRDWHRYLQGEIQRKKEADQKKRQAFFKQRQFGTKPSHPLSAYVGEYSHPAYGVGKITLAQGRLTWSWSSFQCQLEHFHFDTFLVQHRYLGFVELTFGTNKNGKVDRMHVGGRINVTMTKPARRGR